MSCSPADWLRLLPEAMGERAWRQQADAVHAVLGAGTLSIHWRPGATRRLAQLALPTLQVRFVFDGVDAAARDAFMQRFDLYTQRGGG